MKKLYSKHVLLLNCNFVFVDINCPDLNQDRYTRS